MAKRLRIAVFVYMASVTVQAHSAEEVLPSLPEPTSNNAVAMVETDNGPRIYSIQGLLSGKRWSDIHARTWAYDAGQWSELEPVPVPEGRLAGAAIGINDAVWLFGGYTVAEDGAEVSTPEVFRLNSGDRKMEHVGHMPIPVDDMTAFAYQQRYIYLVSGWHDLGNINLVQVLDTQTVQWSQATPYPGAAVFGHAGGLSGSTMLLCGGVRIEYPKNGAARQFLPSEACWQGDIDQDNFRRISWKPVPHHPGPARYRAAAVADDQGHIVFAGGTDNPYNFDGIGYDGRPSEPLSMVLRFNIENARWDQPHELSESSMDHRALLYLDGWFYLVGGMLGGQQVSGRVLRFRFD